jgi:hypothetical protein
MTDTRKLEDQTPENKSQATGELTDGELNQVSGGSGESGQGGQKDPLQRQFQQLIQQGMQSQG